MYSKVLISILVFSLSFSASATSGSSKEPADAQISIGNSYSVNDENGESYEVNVYLPRSYAKEADKEYPVLYLIDGGRDQDFSHIAGLADLASVNPYVYKELIVVGIKTKNRLYELTSINSDPRYARPEGTIGGADKFRGFLRSKVIPFAESKFRVNKKRIVMGESLAGLFIAETLVKTPELFTDYVSISPSLWYDDRKLSKSALKLLNAHSDKSRRLYIAMADEGGTMHKGLDELLSAIKKSKLKNLSVKYKDRRQNNLHWNIYHGEALRALSWLLPVPKPEFLDEPAPWYMIEGANPPGWTNEKNRAKASQ